MIKRIPQNISQYDKANQKLKVAIVKSNYHGELTKSMEQACRKSLIKAGLDDSNIKTFEVPGSWEIPLIVKKIAHTKKFDGIVVFGVIIEGETYHFELIANVCAHSLMDIALEFNIPITFEVLATYTLEQATQRTVGKYNKGVEAARTLLETLKTLSKL